jgi:hypothetical protein
VLVVFADAGLAGLDNALPCVRQPHYHLERRTKMSMFAPSDVRQITVPPDNGGCGVPHELGVDPAARKIDCLPCEAWLQATPSLGWANHPGGVKQTCDEIAQSERDEREAKRVGMSNLANQIALAVGGTPAQAQPSILQQILAMPAEERAALLALIGGAQPALAAAEPAADPEPAAAETTAEGETPPSPKRAPRQPRKATAAAAA